MLRIGVSQINNQIGIENNLASILSALELHASRKSELVLFPECALTGYNREILTTDRKALQLAVERVQAHAKNAGISVALPAPWPNEAGQLQNSILYISGSGEILASFHKIGLQRGEENLFVPGPAHSRILEIKGVRVGIVICVETSHDPWAYLKATDRANLIYWPGFYAATKEEAGRDWRVNLSDKSVRDNLVRHWKIPLLLVNCASSPQAQNWPGMLFGGSAAYAADGTTLFTAERSVPDHFQVEFDEGRIRKVERVKA